MLSACSATLTSDAKPILTGSSTPSTQSRSTIDNSQSLALGGVSLARADAAEITRLNAASDPGSSAYKIGPLDVVEVSVFKVPELSRTVQVADSGTINLPLIGEVPAVGRTAQEIERDLAQRFGRTYLQKPQVNVYVKEYNSQRVTIDGAVRKPGVYPIRGQTTLMQLLATAEGFTDTAQTEVAVFRNAAGGSQQAAKFDVDDIRAGRSEDPKISQGDLVVVGDSAFKTTYQGLLKALPITSVFLTLL